MNYPCTVTNPMLKRKPKVNQDILDDKSYTLGKKFSNQERPETCPDPKKLARPFSSTLHQGGLNFKPMSALQVSTLEKMVEGGLQEHEIAEQADKFNKENEEGKDEDKEKDSDESEHEEQGPVHKLLGKSCYKAQSQFSDNQNKSINSQNYKQMIGNGSTINTAEYHVDLMPAPKKGAAKKKPAEAPKPPSDPAEKKVRAKKAPAPIFPVVEPLPENPN